MEEIKKSATYDEWTIEMAEDHKITVKKNGEVCENTKAELCEIAELIHYDYDTTWITQQLGRNLIEVLHMKEDKSLKIDGRMKVNQLKRNFKCVYDATLRVYDGKKKADEDAPLSSLRKEGCKGGDMACTPEDTVEYFEYFMNELYGIHVEVATIDNWVLVVDKMPLGRIREIGRNSTKEKMEQMLK